VKNQPTLLRLSGDSVEVFAAPAAAWVRLLVAAAAATETNLSLQEERGARYRNFRCSRTSGKSGLRRRININSIGIMTESKAINQSINRSMTLKTSRKRQRRRPRRCSSSYSLSSSSPPSSLSSYPGDQQPLQSPPPPSSVVVVVAAFVRVLMAQSSMVMFCAVVAAANGAYAEYSSESVRALDRYGNAVQLQHAKSASDKRGRLVAAIAVDVFVEASESNDNGAAEMTTMTTESKQVERQIWIVSPSVPQHRRHHHRRAPVRRNADDPLPQQPLVSFLSNNGGNCNRAGTVGLVCSGVQGDATWLLGQLRRYAKTIWDRYGGGGGGNNDDSTAAGSSEPQLLPILAVAKAVAALKRSFWKYEVDGEKWQGPAWTIFQNGDAERDEGWSRPLGVRTLLVSTASLSSSSPQKQHQHQPSLVVVEPSGTIVGDGEQDRHRRIYCIGRDGDAVQAALEERMLRLSSESSPTKNGKRCIDIANGPVSAKDLEDILKDALAPYAAMGGGGGGGEGDSNDRAQLVQLEILHSSSGRIERRQLSLRAAVPKL